MSRPYFAVCLDRGELVVRLMDLSDDVGNHLDEIFDEQEREFYEGITEEITFDGDWRPDKNELLVVNKSEQIGLFEEAMTENPTSYDKLTANDFQDANIRAIFSGRLDGQKPVIAIQRFWPRQVLANKANKLAILVSGDKFSRIIDPAFTIDDKLVAVIKGGVLKFKSFSSISGVFDLKEIYREATDEDVEKFSKRACLNISNIEAFKSEIDQTARKLIHAIEKSVTLNSKTAEEIKKRASTVDLEIDIEDGKVQMPQSRKDIKQLLRFINDDMYEAPLSRRRYVSNSKRLVNS